MPVYDYFYVGTPNTNYKLSIGGYQKWGIGTAGDSMTGSLSNKGMQFSTYDRDNDISSGNCAANTQGAWWHERCGYSRLNGPYLTGQSSHSGLTWYHFNTTAPNWNTLRHSEMKMRRSD